MSAFEFRLIGCAEQLLVEVAPPSLPELGAALTFERFLLGQVVGVDGMATPPRGVLIAVNRVAVVTEPE